MTGLRAPYRAIYHVLSHVGETYGALYYVFSTGTTPVGGSLHVGVMYWVDPYM